MYCVSCGVKLADTEKMCPLCGTAVFHPDIVRQQVQPLYPQRSPAPPATSRAVQIVLTTLWLMGGFIPLICDLQLNGEVTWSGYVVGALIISYAALVLPTWMPTANPVIFVPSVFVLVGLYLLYINFATGGGWFLSFAFPVTGVVGGIITAVTVLVRYIRRGRLYIFGGAAVAMGAFMPLMEFLLCLTFAGIPFLGWSFYPMAVLVLLGGMLIFLAVCAPARETVERKMFI